MKSGNSQPGLRDRFLRAWYRRKFRGYQSLRKTLGYHREDPIRATTTHGANFDLNSFAYIDSCVLREGYYETEVINFICEAVRSGDTIWDVGANFGLHAVTLAQLCSGVRVIAFEPEPSNARRLLHHRELAGVDFEVVTVALSDEEGTASLHIAPTGNSGQTTLSPWHELAYIGTCRVATTRGDALISCGTVPPPAVIKLDVEGHELAALRGLSQCLTSGHCRAVVFEDGPEDDSLVKEFMRNCGYQLHRLSREEDTEHFLANFAATLGSD